MHFVVDYMKQQHNIGNAPIAYIVKGLNATFKYIEQKLNNNN